MGSAEYEYDVPRPLWSEQDPALWWDATQEATRRATTAAGIDAGEVAAVGLTGQMHGAVLLDAADEPLRPAILWNDGRTAEQCELIRTRIGADRLIQLTGNDAL